MTQDTEGRASLFDALRRNVADFPDGKISVESKEIAALLAAYDDARHGRYLARLDAENERRLAGRLAETPDSEIHDYSDHPDYPVAS